MTLKELLVREVSEELSYHYLPKIHQKCLCETFNQFFFNVVPALNTQKPKCFLMASDKLAIISVIKSFNKHPTIVKIITKAIDSIFHFKKTSCIEAEKIK